MMSVMSDDKNRRIEEWYRFLYLAKEDLMQARASLEGAGKPGALTTSRDCRFETVSCYAHLSTSARATKHVRTQGAGIPSEWRDLHREFMGVRKGFMLHGPDSDQLEPRAGTLRIAKP